MTSAIWKRWVPVGLYALCILALSSVPSRNLPEGPEIPHLDKAVHGVVYAGLGFLLGRTLCPAPVAWILGALFGALDELYQQTSPGRDSDPADWVADAVGVALGLTGWRVWRKLQHG